MSIQDAARAMREFTTVIREATDMATAGATGEVLDEAVRHASELLDIIDEELLKVDPTGRTASAAARRNFGNG